MRLIRLDHKDIELLFAIDAIDREVLVELLAEKLKDSTYDRRNRIAYMLHALSPGHEALPR